MPEIEEYVIKSGDICDIVKGSGSSDGSDVLSKETDWEDEEDDY